MYLGIAVVNKKVENLPQNVYMYINEFNKGAAICLVQYIAKYLLCKYRGSPDSADSISAVPGLVRFQNHTKSTFPDLVRFSNSLILNFSRNLDKKLDKTLKNLVPLVENLVNHP